MRRKPVNNSRRIAARAVAFSPATSVSRIVCPSLVISSIVRNRRCLRSGGFFTPRAGLSLISLSDFLAYSRTAVHAASASRIPKAAHNSGRSVPKR
jgi:hypothetical protein